MLFSTLLWSSLVGMAWARSRGDIAKRQAQPYPVYTFDQPIDHFPQSSRYVPHTNATFKQRYWFDDTYYKPGGPVYLYIGGETSGTNRLSNLETGIIQILMEATNGLGVVLENRYYGQSVPFPDMSTDHLAYLTTEQSIADNAYFAQHATFKGINASLIAPVTNWILYGGSLAGAQTAFSMNTYGDILFGGIGSSATTYAMLEYPQWYDPIQKLGPQDCIQSINAIIDKFDHLISTNNRQAVQEFKSIFGLQDLVSDQDFAMTIAFPLGGPMNYPTATWQELNWYPAYGYNDFFDFCHNVTNADAPANITAIDTVLSNYTHGQSWTNLGNYANYVKNVLVDEYCTSQGYTVTECYSLQNASSFADSTNSGSRAYLYSTCTEAGLYQTARKGHGPTLLSRVMDVNYTQQWCTWSFPAGTYNSIPETPDLDKINIYGGLKVEADRLAHIDGDNDVWLDVCFHSNLARGLNGVAEARGGSDLRPEYLISGAGHHWDSYGILDVQAEPQFIREAHLWEIRIVKKWLSMGRGSSTKEEL